MIDIGKYQELEVRRFVDFGAYLAKPGEYDEVLIPSRYIEPGTVEGQTVRVFVYKDNEGRPVATTERPHATVGEFAYLRVTEVNDIGAFLDWGLMKEILVPYREQKVRMRGGGVYLVYVYLDHITGRIVASSKIDKFLGNVYPDYKPGQAVDALVTEQTAIGYKVIVDNKHRGIIYSNEIFRPIELEEHIRAYVKHVREDGKIDLTLSDRADRRTATLADRVLDYLKKEGAGPVSEKMPPTYIEMMFQCSKKDFKKAVGKLYREERITISDDGVVKLRVSKKQD